MLLKSEVTGDKKVSMWQFMETGMFGIWACATFLKQLWSIRNVMVMTTMGTSLNRMVDAMKHFQFCNIDTSQ